MKAFCYNCSHFDNQYDSSYCNEMDYFTEPMNGCDSWKPNDNMLVIMLLEENSKLKDKISELEDKVDMLKYCNVTGRKYEGN